MCRIWLIMLLYKKLYVAQNVAPHVQCVCACVVCDHAGLTCFWTSFKKLYVAHNVAPHVQCVCACVCGVWSCRFDLFLDFFHLWWIWASNTDPSFTDLTKSHALIWFMCSWQATQLLWYQWRVENNMLWQNELFWRDFRICTLQSLSLYHITLFKC